MNNSNGDDLFLNRLFSYLKEELVIPVDEIRMIRRNVFLLKSNGDLYVIKGFNYLGKLQVQEAFTSSLKNEGFLQTYTFQNFAKEPPLLVDEIYFGCLEHIPLSSNSFTFETKKDRKEGLLLLDDFHHTTKKLIGSYRPMLKEYKLVTKWRERSARFINNFSIIKFFVQQEIIHEIMEWADLSLKGLDSVQAFQKDGNKVILHGDLAHHNFLRASDNQLFLIDFDLISVGKPVFDYLQYSNRILPHLEWSFDELYEYQQLKPFLKDEGFLYALIFPTDIFREWNRLVKERQYTNPFRVRQVLDLTVRQFYNRQKFVEQIKRLINV